MAARVLQKFRPTLPEKLKGGKLEKIGRIVFYFIDAKLKNELKFNALIQFKSACYTQRKFGKKG